MELVVAVGCIKLERSWAISGLCWASWSYVEPSWGHVGPMLGPCWAYVGAGHLGAMLGLSWAILGPCWGQGGAPPISCFSIYVVFF